MNVYHITYNMINMVKIIFEEETILYADGGMNKQTGDEAWGSVVDDNYKDVISEYLHLVKDLNIKNVNLPAGSRNIVVSNFTDVKSQQNNGAELLSLLVALRVAKYNKDIEIIYYDSTTVNCWSTKGPLAKTLKKMDKNKLAYIQECIELRKYFEGRGGKVLKIEGKNNKADLGYHHIKQ